MNWLPAARAFFLFRQVLVEFGIDGDTLVIIPVEACVPTDTNQSDAIWKLTWDMTNTPPALNWFSGPRFPVESRTSLPGSPFQACGIRLSIRVSSRVRPWVSQLSR
jgi:hypothetical protein